MSLPPKLLERLKKRGIIQEENNEQSKKIRSELSSSTKQRPSIVIGCPNKYNIYHDCNNFCETKYGKGLQSPSTKIKRIYEILIENYPLSEDWQCIWDSGCACFYFYNINSNESSWLPPGHPKFRSTKGIRVLKGEIDDTIKSTNENKINDQLDEPPSSSVEQSEGEKKIDEEFVQFDNELNSELSTLNKEEPINEQLDKQEQWNEDSDETNESNQESASDSEQSSSDEAD